MSARLVAVLIVVAALLAATVILLLGGTWESPTALSNDAAPSPVRASPAAGDPSKATPPLPSFPKIEPPKQPPVSKAPWNSLHRRYLAGDHAALIANARAAPHLGSYFFGMRAVTHCLQVKTRGSYDEQVEILRRMGGVNEALRLAAWEKLHAPCQETGDLDFLKRERGAFEVAMAAGHDALATLLRDSERLVDPSIPAAERQRKVVELLDLDDPVAVDAARHVLVARGATFEGAPVPEADALAYRLAWDLAMCSRYGQCQGPESERSHWDCLAQMQCDYRTTQHRVQQMAGSQSQRVADWYVRLERRLAARDFAAFGVP